MRLRNVRGAKEAMIDSPLVFEDPTENAGRWKDIFGNDNPIHIEVGMGKGKFITELARNNPNINYIGIEKYSSVLIRALQKREEGDKNTLSNLFYIRMDAENITNVFATGEIAKIYLNFSDPWPKDRHAKRRLTSPQFLSRYDKILVHDGTIEFKTDNQDLFTFSLESVKESNWNLVLETRDLHNSQYCIDNVMTEYEEKFSSMGNQICKLIAYR